VTKNLKVVKWVLPSLPLVERICGKSKPGVDSEKWYVKSHVEIEVGVAADQD